MIFSIWFYLILVGIFLLIYLSFYEHIFKKLTEIIDEIRTFIIKNESFISILFLIIFTMEQLLLIIFSHFYGKDITSLQIIIALFALIVLFTSSFEKILLNVATKHYKEQSAALAKGYLFMQDYLRFKKLKKK